MQRASERAPTLLGDWDSASEDSLDASRAPEVDDGFAAQPLAQYLAARKLLLVTTLFWTFITLSNVLYAQSMRITMARFTQATVFSPWSMRVLQHVALYPLLYGCYWVSLRLGWKGVWRTLLQAVVALLFASSAYFAMDVAEFVYWGLFMPPSHMQQIDVVDPFDHTALWTSYFTSFLITYGFGLALVTGIAFYRRYHQAELRMSALEREWGSARLSALRMQLSPHTLFNLLHTIRGQIHFNPEAAREMVVQLADLLRRLLGAGQQEFSLLAEELEFVRLYLELQQQRFSDRLSIMLPDEEAQPATWVPSLILQPLVENAVVHGLSGHEAPVEVRVECVLDAGTLILRVTNTVAAEPAAGHNGIGLNNVRERLKVQFGRRASLSAGRTRPDTWVAEVKLPVLREARSSQPTAAQVAG